MTGDEMDNSGYDQEARVARVAERVDNQGMRITHLETIVNKGFADISAQFRGIQESFSNQFSSLSSELRAKDRTPWSVIWSAIGVCAVIIFGIGGALYYPVRETMAELKAENKADRAEFARQIEKVQDDRVADLQRQIDRLLDEKQSRAAQ